MKIKVFIDGKAGTTGLKIYDRLEKRADITLLKIAESDRKDPIVREKLINESDITILCLPDTAAEEAVNLCTNPRTKIIDCSTAHRVSEGWSYGFRELDTNFLEGIKKSFRVANPGCYASGALSILYPLVKNKVINCDYPVTIHAVSGYSGGGKRAITQYTTSKDAFLTSPRLYSLGQEHKHLKEITKISGLSFPPIFSPYICNFFSGMSVTVPLHTRFLGNITLTEIQNLLEAHYKDSYFVRVLPLIKSDKLNSSFIDATRLCNTNFMDIQVYGNNERVLITSTFDNLGKGASGSALQNLNIMMGQDEKLGLI